MNSFTDLPVASSLHECNPLSLRIFRKTYDEDIIDGGTVICEKFNRKLKIKNKKEANWLLTKNSLFYIHSQSLTIEKFSFNNWAVASALGLMHKKKKNFSCIRIFKIEDPLNDRFYYTILLKNNYVDYYDFYVSTGSELNISLVNSLFLDNLEL